MLFTIKHFLRQCASRNGYLIRRMCIVGAVICLFLMLIFDFHYATTMTALGQECFTYCTFALLFFIVLFVPVVACKAIDDDRRSNVLPLLLMTKRSSLSIIFHKYVSILTLICIHGIATVPIFLMCAHFGGISSQQIFLTYTMLFFLAACLAIISIMLTSKYLFSATKCLMAAFTILAITEALFYFINIPLSPIFRIYSILGGYSQEIFYVSIIYSIFITVCLFLGCPVQIHFSNEAKQNYFLNKIKSSQKSYRTNLTIEDSLVRREEKRQEFRSLHSFTNKVCYVATIGFIPFLSHLVPIFISPFIFLGLGLYAALAFTDKNKQELELLSMAYITPDRFLKAKKKAMLLAIIPLKKYLKLYAIAILLTIYFFPNRFILQMIYTTSIISVWVIYVFTHFAFYCSAKYKDIITVLTITSLATASYFFVLLFFLPVLSTFFFIFGILSTYFLTKELNSRTLELIFPNHSQIIHLKRNFEPTQFTTKRSEVKSKAREDSAIDNRLKSKPDHIPQNSLSLKRKAKQIHQRLNTSYSNEEYEVIWEMLKTKIEKDKSKISSYIFSNKIKELLKEANRKN